MGECKTKAIQTNLGNCSNNLIYPGIIQAYSGIFRTLCYFNIFKTLVCSEPWHIQNQKHIQNPATSRTLAYSKSEAYTELCHTSIMKLTNYNYFEKLDVLK